MNKKSNASLNRFSGIWQTNYTYYSSIKNAEMESKHYVRVYSKDNWIIVETIPEVNDSYLYARFSIDGNIATGTWQEGTSPKGVYKGVIYHGAGQLVLSDDGKSFKGKWIGFGHDMTIKTGPWEFTYLGEDLSVVHDRAHGQ